MLLYDNLYKSNKQFSAKLFDDADSLLIYDYTPEVYLEEFMPYNSTYRWFNIMVLKHMVWTLDMQMI